MRFPTATLAFIALAPPAAVADELTTVSWYWWWNWFHPYGLWTTGYGTYPVNPEEGCRDPADVPGLNSVCFDWGNKRAHFYFDNQNKRCLSQWHWADIGPCVDNNYCSIQRWVEVPCTW